MSVVSLNNTINSKLYESGVFDIDTSNINDATSEGSTASTKLATMAADVGGLCNCNCNDPDPAHPSCVRSVRWSRPRITHTADRGSGITASSEGDATAGTSLPVLGQANNHR